jgi:hypothetical protein
MTRQLGTGASEPPLRSSRGGPGAIRPILGVMATRRALISALLASACVAGPEPPPSPVQAAPSPTRSPALATTGGATATLPANPDEALMHAFIAFARSPSPRTLATIPFAAQVQLGLADRLLVERRSAELERPESWVLDVECCFRGGVGAFSALELLKRASAVTISVGPHPHCVSPPVPPPPEVAALRRVSVQPKQGPGESCLQWWTVDVFLLPDDRIAAVTLDHYEP